MKPEELARLRAIADAATQGEWKTEPGNGALDFAARFPTEAAVLVVAESDCEHHPISDTSCNGSCRTESEQAANAAHIAAFSPATAKRLLDHIASLEDALRNLVTHTEGLTLPVAASVMRERARAALGEGV